MNNASRPIEGMEQSLQPSHAAKGKDPINPYVLLFAMLVVAAIATWLVPAGEFSRTVKNGVSLVIPNSLKAVPQHGVMPGEMFVTLAKGMIVSAPIIFLILFTGGALAVLDATGAVRSALGMVARGDGARAPITVIVICLIFSLLGTLGVVTNSVVAFVPLGLLLAESMGLSKEIGAGLIYLGTYAGFNTGILNPVTTGLSQRLAGLPMFSGMAFRVCIYIAFLIVTIVFLIARIHVYRSRGAAQSAANPVTPRPNKAVPPSPALQGSRLDLRQSAVVGIMIVCLSVFVYGALTHHWAETEMVAMFLIMAIAAGVVSGIRAGKIADTFLQGCGGLVKGALVVGLARAISIVLSDGRILDPIVNMLAGWLAPLDSTMAAIAMFLSAALMHVGISSGSGESAVLIPIFAPLGDALHLTRQMTVQAVLLGEGFMNCFNPTSGVLMAVLATSGIPYLKWLRFVAPLLLAWFVICVAAIAAGVAMHFGPF
ncbi:YfcC family protein [Cupriavidus basilensis]|uniref:YfcC family protein n=1 Tax=Cupriavidus basilensis TaxID=68895 RepID=UPI0023E78A06|nr:Na+/H+ antiporter NhaC family protein [Cupriavidus basilensis]MDF3881984.1 Na+/H+ antiporter NhaC family protein [Cupriavidus basilensis]